MWCLSRTLLGLLPDQANSSSSSDLPQSVLARCRSTDLEGTGVDTYEQSSKVFFRDAILPASESEEEDSEASELGIADGSETRQGLSRAPARIKRKQRVDRQKLIIILVGLPGRGKTFLCNKLMCYLNW